jgi:hypothetical protein
MDVDHESHRAKETAFDKQADDDVLRRSAPRKLTGLDLAEARLAVGDTTSASAMARQAIAQSSKEPAVDTGRANFILARVDLMTGHPEQAAGEFQTAASTAKETRILAWSHIYLGRMEDLRCSRDAAVSEYQQALAVRDGQQDTRIAAERGVKTAFAVRGHSCDQDADPDAEKNEKDDDKSGSGKKVEPPPASTPK